MTHRFVLCVAMLGTGQVAIYTDDSDRDEVMPRDHVMTLDPVEALDLAEGLVRHVEIVVLGDEEIMLGTEDAA